MKPNCDDCNHAEMDHHPQKAVCTVYKCDCSGYLSLFDVNDVDDKKEGDTE